ETGDLPQEVLSELGGLSLGKNTVYGSCVVAVKPGDGSAREQAASCQRVLGGVANIANEYATKRYRSNLINWGMVPFLCQKEKFSVGDYVYVEGIREAIENGSEKILAKHISAGKVKDIVLSIGGLTPDEKKIILAGCLINYNKNNAK
ncbi:MAG: hydratase, partial [Clostridia bacterium]|nr:hydratase [Clostridia bacterium]